MVCIIHDCHCLTCPGSTKFPNDGVMRFGGSLCNCPCHELKGSERDEFIKRKEALNGSRVEKRVLGVDEVVG